MSTFYRDLEPVSKQVTIVIGLTVVGFMAFGLAISFYRNVLFADTLRKMRIENETLGQRVAESRADLDYYRSFQYKDKYAKQNLGKLNVGEKILIITTPTKEDLIQEDASVQKARKQAEYDAYLRDMPTIEHWKLYLWQRDRLEKLREGL